MSGAAQQSKLLSLLSDGERHRLRPYFQDVVMRQGQELLEMGQPMDHVWFPHDCVTSTLVDSPDGTTIEVGLMGYEGMVGLSAALGKRVSNTTVIVQIPGSAARMSIENFMRHVVEPRSELLNYVLEYTDNFMTMVAQTAACNSLHSIDERLARWILMVHDRVARDEIQLTQEFLAYMLGVRRPSVSLAAGGLQRMGVIRYTRGNITLLDRARLEEIACPCYSIVRNIVRRMYERGSRGRPASA